MALHYARGTAMADIINGTVELIQNSTDSKTTDASGLSTNSKSQVFFQRYQLFYDQALFPFVSLRVGSGFDKAVTDIQDPAGDARSTNTNIYPSAALRLNNPLVSSGVGYNMREEKIEGSGALPVTTRLESKNAYLGFRPEGLPTLDMLVTRAHSYDKARAYSDSENDLFAASARFTPVNNLDLAYTVAANNNNDLLSGVKYGSVSQNGRAAYNNQFFDNRVTFAANYNAFRTTSETHSGSSGEVNFQLFPFTGLSDISDIPTLETLGTNQALIDGNLTASSGINIGQGVSFGGDTRLRNVGLDFVNITSVNTLYLYVDRQLPNSVADAFMWDIYTSADNQNWTAYQTNLHGTFDPFTNRFEILFPDITTRYIKATVRPLSVAVIAPPGTDVSNIYVTELQAYARKSSDQVAGKIQTTSQLYDLNLRTALVKDRSLSYNVYYSEANSSAGSSTSFLSNALSFSKQFSTVYSGAARLERDDSRTGSLSTVSYIASASLMVVPLPTLTHSLVLSSRRDELQGQNHSSESLFLYNTASLYRGFDVNLSGGVSLEMPVTGAQTRSTLINAGASIIPNKFLSMSVNHSETQSTQALNGVNRAGTTIANVAWSPFTVLYLGYSITETSATNSQHQTIQNYSASWSPFSSGALNFSCVYSDNRETRETTNLDRAFTTGMQWRVGPRILLTAGYSVSRSSSLSQSTDANNFSTDLRMSF